MLKKVLLGLGVLVALLAGYVAYGLFFPPEEFRPQPNPSADCPTDIFDKSAVVFDVLLVCGTSGVPSEKLVHAANVAAEWLDNDEDGRADDEGVIAALERHRPVVVMARDGIPFLQGAKIFAAFDGYAAQGLWAEETATPGRRDASQEEIHHVVMNAGWQKLAPEIFSEDPADGSDLYRVWKYADDNGYYSYGDPTCDDSCKVTEFVYLATAAYLGSTADLFSDELTLKTREALRETLPEVVEIFESRDYVYPLNHWPDGSYPHPSNVVLSGVSGASGGAG